MTAAKNIGIDGFALNIGELPEQTYSQLIDLILCP